MPVRILRPGITTSERFNACDWFTQSLYVRLLTLVDDFGRYDASARLLKSHAFPLSDDVTTQAIAASCEQLSANGLVQFYEADGKKCLQITKWQERVRSKSKYADPPADICAQLTAIDSKPPTIDSNCRPPTPTPTPYALRLTPAPEARAVAERPSLAEVQAYAAQVGLAPWKAEDWFNEMEGCGWLDFNHRPVIAWRPLLVRVKTKWEADGRPTAPPASKHAQKPNAAHGGPSWREVAAYAAEKDDAEKSATAYAAGWFRAWEGRGWKTKDGKTIDWKVKFSADLASRGVR